MIGNKIQSPYLEESDYPKAAALSFLMMAAVLILVLVYIGIAGTEAFMAARRRRARMDQRLRQRDPRSRPARSERSERG